MLQDGNIGAEAVSDGQTGGVLFFRALTVTSGRRECRQIREVNASMRLFAESMAGGFGGTTKYEGEIRSMGIRCWDWVLRDGSTSEIRLVPCDFSDGRRGEG